MLTTFSHSDTVGTKQELWICDFRNITNVVILSSVSVDSCSCEQVTVQDVQNTIIVHRLENLLSKDGWKRRFCIQSLLLCLHCHVLVQLRIGAD